MSMWFVGRKQASFKKKYHVILQGKGKTNYFCNIVAFYTFMKEARDLLGQKGMSKTPCRLEMLSVLLESDSALSELDIKERMRNAYDRATIFRNLKAFLKERLIHAVPIERGEIRYQISTKHAQMHAHFHCKLCSNLFCLQEIELRKLALPEGYSAEEYDLVIKGFCQSCAASNDAHQKKSFTKNKV